jgi:peptide/nickel transport system substrate-binding protein
MIEQADYHDHPPSFAPNLVESWDWSEDHLTLTMNLRTDAKWSDGVPVTSKDVLFTWQTQMSPEVAWSGSYLKDYIDKVEAEGAHTIRFHFNHLYPYQLSDANEGLIIPAHAWGEIPYQEWRDTDWTEHTLSAGPFRLEHTTRNQEIVLVRNDTYWRQDRPLLDSIVWRVVPSEASLLTQLRTGAIDMVRMVPAQEAARVDAAPATDLLVFSDRRYTYVGWNNQRPMFADPRVRRALTMAIDRSAIVETVIAGYGRVAVGPILSFMWAFNDELEPLPYDPEQARSLLAEAGWSDSDGDGLFDRDGQPFAFELLTNTETQHHQDACTLIHEQLGRIGIAASIRLLDLGALISLMDSGEFDAYLASWHEPTMIDLEDLWHTTDPEAPGSNFVGYSNPEVDRLIVEANQASDFQTQKPLFDRIQELIVADQPYTFMYESFRRTGISTRIHGEVINDASPYFNLEDWYVADAGSQAGSSP